MRYTARNNRGFSLTRVLLVILLMALIATAGVVLWQMQDDEEFPAKNTTKTSNSESSDMPDTVVGKKGTFSGVASKTGSGSVTLTQNAEGANVVQLGDDFAVQEGPDLFVSFGNEGEVDQDTLFSTLDAFSGKQEYTVPENIDVTKYSQVIIYCKEFSVVFSVASLQ